jgi:hypothetical protein
MDKAPEIPAEALRFASPARFSADDMPDGKKRRKVEGVAYSGDLLTGHWYWSAVIFDLAGIERPAGRIPLLMEHDRGKRVGHTGLDIGADALRLSDAVLLDTERGREIADEADQGFPWQMSVHIEPTRIEELQQGASTVVNGRQVAGPATIFRASRIREVSLTPTGVDPNTGAAVFSTRGAVMPDTAPPAVQASADVSALQQELTDALKRAEEAETKLAALQLAARTEKVKALFAAIGRDYSDTDAAPFLAMDDAAFSAAAEIAQFKAPAPPAHLFGAGPTPTGDTKAPSLNPADIFAARRAKSKE